MKHKLLYAIFCIVLSIAYLSCEKDDENLKKAESNNEIQNIHYGVSKNDILSTRTFGNLRKKLIGVGTNKRVANSDSIALSLTPSELLDRLDLGKAYFYSDSIKEVFDAPVKTWGSYGRVFRTLTKG